MEATSVYPNWPPVLTATGLGGSLAGTDPDHITFDPDLTNDPRKRYSQRGGAVDAIGVMRLHVRNAQGYAYLRPHQPQKLLPRSDRHQRRIWAKLAEQTSYYRHNYRHYVPHELLTDYLQHESPLSGEDGRLSEWQGNGIAGVDCGQNGHIVFYPTGQVLQQACAWYSGGGSEGKAGCKSTVIETGTPIRQFAVMGSSEACYSGGSGQLYAAARGITNCTIVATPAQVTPGKLLTMQAKAKFSFPTILTHIAGSPHAEAELAFITTDGIIRWWEPESGVQKLLSQTNTHAEHFHRCEYSSHPRVLWAVNKTTITTVDLRQPPSQTNTLFDLSSAGTAGTIYDMKRRARYPFQCVVGSGVSVELLDSRMAKQSLISWTQPQSFSGKHESMLGAIDEVDLSRNANDNRGYIVSCSQRRKVTTLFPFERNRKRQRNNVLKLSSLRSNADDEYSEVKRSNTEQIVASDSPLDLHMVDGGEWTSLMGICALRDEVSLSASVYQLNSVGDLFSHRVTYSRSSRKSYHAAVQPNLPCGVTGQDAPLDASLSRTLPLPVDAILPEHDMDSLIPFNALPVKVLRRQFPRLPDDGDDSDSDVSIKGEEGEDETKEAKISSRKRSRSFDTRAMASKLLSVCDPSASLYRLHRYVVDELKTQLSSSELLRILQSHREFQVRNVRSPSPTDSFQALTPASSRGGRDNIHVHRGDPRLAVCECSPGISPEPCESMSCIIPHAIIVSSTSTELHFDEISAPTSNQTMSEDFAAALEEARDAYEE